MNPFFEYLIKSSVSLALFYIVFKLAVSRDKMHSLNRFVLLGILMVSAILPFTDISIIHETEAIPRVEVFREFVLTTVFMEPVSTETVQLVTETSGFSINPWLAFYLSVIIILIFRLVTGVIRVIQIIGRAEKRRLRKIVLAVVKDLIQPFTFLNRIVLSEKDFTENKDIIVAHEHAHIKQMHAVDLMVCEVFTVLHFFNPFMWLLRHDLKLLHEYQADEAVLKKGIDVKKYQLLVLQKSVGERRFAMANYFSQKPILKRLKMMQKKNKKQWNGVKLILFIPIILMLLQAFAQPEMLVEKAGEFVPSIIQKDSSEIWLDNWVNSKMSQLLSHELNQAANSNKLKKVEVLNIVGTGKEKFLIDGESFNEINVFIILQNRLGKKLIEDEYIKDEQLQSVFENFIKGKNTIKNVETDYELKSLPFVGDTKISKGIIIYRRDMETPKASSESILKTIGEAYLGVRKEIALREFNQKYFSLSKEKKNVINLMIPIRFSISPPNKQKTPPPPPPPKFVVKLYNDKIILWNEEIAMSEVSEKAEEFLKKAKGKYSVIVYIEDAVSEERYHKFNNELKKTGLNRIDYVEMK